MTNHVRFFIDDNEFTADQFVDIPIPQMGSTVFLRDKMYCVDDITYSFACTNYDYNLIDVFVTNI